MNKKGIILLAVLMIAGGAVFASGQQGEADNDDYTRGRGTRIEDNQRGGRFGASMMEDMDEVAMTGDVVFTSTGTSLTVDGAEWTLLYPSGLVEMEIEDGTEITVTGWALPTPEDSDERRGPRWDFEEGALVFHVSSVEIDGATYELDFEGGPGNGGRNDRKPMSGSRRG